MKITAITHVGNDGAFLLEWIAFNRIIGVTDFLIYSADNDDGTHELLQTLQASDVIQHVPQSSLPAAAQTKLLRHARECKIVSSADWIWISEVEEFLNIKTGNGTIPDLISACNNPGALSINLQYFASDGIQDFEDIPVISQFMHSHNPDLWCEHQAIEVKTLTRNDFPLHYYGRFRPFISAKQTGEQPLIWKDGSGRNVPKNFLTAANPLRIRRFPATGSRRLATLNHYALRSVDSYLVKATAGDFSGEKRKFDQTYWQERNDDGFYDDSILRYMPALETEIENLKSIPEIRNLHDATVMRHREKIELLMQNRAFANLRAQLISTPNIPPAESRLIRQLSQSFVL